MILGDRCTRACGFCQVDTRKPLAVDADEPRRVAEAVVRDRARARGRHVRRARRPARRRRIGVRGDRRTRSGRSAPGRDVELLISDCKGDAAALDTIFARRARRAEPQPRDRRAAAARARARRPATRARSPCSPRAKAAGLATKSGIILGMGETVDEVRAALADLRARRRRHPHDRPVPAAVGASTCRSRGGGRPTSSTRSRGYADALGFAPRRGRAARALQLPRPRAAIESATASVS